MSEQFLRLPQVMETTGLKKSFIWASIKQGNFPKQIKITPRVSVWKKSDIDMWIAERIEIAGA